MKYIPGDCLIIPVSADHHIIVYVAMSDEVLYHLAFLDYYGASQPATGFFENCSFFVTLFGMGEQRFAAFEAVTIGTAVLENDAAVARISHLDLPGQIGLNGLTPLAEVIDIASYFEQHPRNYRSQEPDPVSPFTRSAITLNELARYATPINPFATVKLYKEQSDTVLYWQIYGSADPACVVISNGVLGAMGEYQEIKDIPLDILKDSYEKLITEAKEQGYKEWKDVSGMLLQFGTEDGWGAEDDLDFRNEVWDYLDRYLFWTGNGAITGGDIGSGSINLFFEAISPEMAVSTITTALAEKQILRPYIIALEDKNVPNGAPDFGIRVLYPANYDGNFSY